MKKKVKNILKPLKYIFLAVFILGVIIDMFLFKSSLGFLILVIFLFWLLSVWLFDFSPKISFYLVLAFLGLTVFLVIFKATLMANKTMSWLYLFFFWATAQQLKDLLKDS